MSGAPFPKLGRFRIVAELGRGAMGVVYKAEDPLLSRIVAIKTIIMSPDAEERAEFEARFYQEAKAAGGLNHPTLITIHDIGREGDIAYMAMELLEGVDLREMMRQGRLELALALDIAAQVADGLAHAHEHGVVHRDVKPGNIMIVRGRHAKIMDFGIARLRVSDVKTQAGSVLGSPRYLSPEQVTGQRADHRSDLFSFGIVLYEMLTGATPFSGADMTQLLYQIGTAMPPPPSAINPALPAMLDLIVAKALEKDADARYQSAKDLAADLRACGAELSSVPGVPSAAAGTDRTVKLDVDLGATRTLKLDATETVRAAASGASADAATFLPLSRRFDSTEAVRGLVKRAMATDAGNGDAHAATPSPSAATHGAFWRLLHDPGRLFFAAAVLSAAVIAVVIAVSG